MKNLYGSRWIAYAYDILASLVWLPSKHKLYDKSLSLTSIGQGDMVLELGCGTGFLTQKLQEKGTETVAVDFSRAMLDRAGRRAPKARFIYSNVLHYTDSRRYNYILLFFLLHELDFKDRKTLLGLAKNLLKENGEIIICDFSIPRRGIMKTLFPLFLRLWEPKSTGDFLREGITRELRAHDLTVFSSVYLHNERVQLLRVKALVSWGGK